MLLAGWLQLRHQVRLWTIPSVESALDASLEANRRAFSRLQRHLESEGRVLAESRFFAQAADTAALGELLEAGHRQFGIDLAQYWAWEGDTFRLLVSRGVEADVREETLRILNTAGPQRPQVLRLQSPNGDLLAVPTYLWHPPPDAADDTDATHDSDPGEADAGSDTPGTFDTPGMSNAPDAPDHGVGGTRSQGPREPVAPGATPPRDRLRGALVLGIQLGPRYYERLGEVTAGLSFYRRLQEFGRVLRAGYAALAILGFLGSMVLSLALARSVARSVSRPVENLIRRMEKGGRGASDSGAAAESSIPEMTRLAQAFGSMQEMLVEYEAQLRETERVRGTQETARFVAHEIRNTLTPIAASLSVLGRQIASLEGEPRARGERALALIRRESDRLAALAGAFSEYARFPDRHPTRLDLRALAEEVAAGEIPARIRLRVAGPTAIPSVEADRDEIERVVRNLLRNAVEAIQGPGEITLSVEPAAEGRVVRLIVEDDGPGMDEETLQKSLQPGFTTKQAGTGLGLPLVRRTVTRNGGTLVVESRPGDGTRVRIELPAAGTDPDGETA